MIEKECQCLVNGWIAKQVIVVEDKNGMVGGIMGGINKSRQDRIVVWRHCAEEYAQLALHDLRLYCLPHG